jgi:DMSO/TMAO reductase YedYZ molybdopterin-dependent catalytic subunit
MNRISRRNWIAGGLGTAAAASGLTVAAKLARRYNLIPPDAGTLYGPGETMTYASQRILTEHALAREFQRNQISKRPFANETSRLGDKFTAMQKTGFSDWRLQVDGLVARPTSFSLSDIKTLRVRHQITALSCEEGWSYIAEWIGTPLHYLLQEVGILDRAKWIVYRSFQQWMWNSIDLADALHPQTFVTYAMNSGDLPVGFGGPLRLRVPRQLGYKSCKYLNHITVTDNIKQFGKGLGSIDPEGGYSWYAGI